MPLYCVQCEKCGWKADVYCAASARYTTACLRCGHAPLDTDWQRQGAPKSPAELHGFAAVDFTTVFDKDGVAEIKRDVPDIEFVPDRIDGRCVNPVYRNSAHMDRVAKQMADAMRRVDQERESEEAHTHA